jgi:NADPH:quinone reductase-like Zn-dependent oxidoreductase
LENNLGYTMSIPETMKAMLLTGHGGLEKLVLNKDWPTPDITAEEVLIKVGACGINNTDIWVREGAYGASDDPDAVASFGDSPLQFPLIQGADIAGKIVGCGKNVDPSRKGQRVIVDFGIYAYIGSGRPGGFAEYVAVPAENAHSIETDLSDVELATFCCAYITGEHMLRRARVTAGENVLVTGASGGVGSGVVQLCRARGAIPYAVVGAGKEEAVKAIGAEGTITRGKGNFIEAVFDATSNGSIDVVVDTVSGPMLPELIEILKPQGRYTTCGAMGGPMVEIDMRRIYLKNLDIHGASQGTRRDFKAVRDYALAALDELGRAQEEFKKKKFVGKLVIEVS